MDPWEQIRRAAADRRSGAVEVTLRAAQGVGALTSKREVLRAARILLRAQPAMAPLWRLLAAAFDADDPSAAARAFAERLDAETGASADGARWVVTRRGSVVVTHSASSAVLEALDRARGKIGRVLCTTSLPGGEGRPFAKRLERIGLTVEVVPDATIATACARADVAIVGADAVTERGVVNKVGTALVALAAREAGIGCYAIASSGKLLPARIADRVNAPLFEATPLDLFDAVLTERGPRRPPAIRRSVGRVVIPRALEALLK